MPEKIAALTRVSASTLDRRRRFSDAARRSWPSGVAGRVLLGLIIVGVALRLLAIISWWPVTPTLEDGYQRFAAINPFIDPQHPVGYDLIVAGLARSRARSRSRCSSST